MAEGDLIVRMMSQGEAQVYDSVMKLAAAWSKTDDATKKAGDEARKVAKEEAELGRQAARVREEMLTPLDRYTKKVAELDNLLKRGKLTQDEHNQAVRNAKTAMDAAGQAGDTALTGMIGNLKRLVAGWFSVQYAISLVRGEYDAMREKEARAAQTALSAAQAQSLALINLGATTPEARDAFEKRIEEISQRTTVSRKDLYQRAAYALSARGPLSEAEAMQAVEESARYVPGDVETGKTWTGAALDLQKIMRGRGQNVTAKQAIGYVATVGQKARVVEPALLATNVVPAMLGAMETGATEQEAGALWAAITQAVGDPTGRKSGTAAIQVVRGLLEMLPAEQVSPFGEMGEGGEFITSEAQSKAIRGGFKDWASRLKALREDPELRKQVLAKLPGEVKTRTAVEQILSGKGTAAESYAQFLTELPSMTAAGPLYEERLKVMQGATGQKLAKFQRGMDVALEDLDLLDPSRAAAGMIRDKYKPILEAVGMSRIGARLTTLGWETSPAKAAAFAGELRIQERHLRRPMQILGGGDIPESPIPRQPTVGEIKQADILGRLADAVEKLGEDFRQSTANLNEASQKIADSTQPNPTMAGRDQ